MSVKTIPEMEASKVQVKSSMNSMIKRIQVVCAQLNYNNGEMPGELEMVTQKSAEQAIRSHTNKNKASIYESMFEDKELSMSDKIDLIIDYFYLTFLSTFKALQAMLEKKYQIENSSEI